MRIDFDVEVLRGEFSQHARFLGSRLRVPLRGRAAAGQQNEWVIGVGRLSQRAWFCVEKLRFAVVMIVTAVFEEAVPNGFASSCGPGGVGTGVPGPADNADTDTAPETGVPEWQPTR